MEIEHFVKFSRVLACFHEFWRDIGGFFGDYATFIRDTGCLYYDVTSFPFAGIHLQLVFNKKRAAFCCNSFQFLNTLLSVLFIRLVVPVAGQVGWVWACLA